METKITLFKNSDFGEIRTLNINDEPWFALTDICEILELTRGRKVAERLDEDEVGTFDVPHPQNPVKTIKMVFVNESGLYNVILRSDKPNAKPFRKWITSEVLPALRKTGIYTLTQKPDSYTIGDPIARAKRWIEEKEQYIALENKIKADEPLVEFASHIQSSNGSISMNEMAKLAAKNGIKIGRNRLFKLLREKGILDDRNVPYQRYIEGQPWFEVVEYTYYLKNIPTLGVVTKVTPKGQMGIIRLLKLGDIVLS